MKQQLLIVTVLVAGFIGGTLANAQQGTIRVNGTRNQTVAVKPLVVSGPDVGFRIESRRGSVALGKMVVRVDGGWVDAEFAPGVVTVGAVR